MKRSLLVGGAVITIGAATVGGLGIASAASNPESKIGQSSLVDKLVAKFNLNKADVQKVFDEEHSARETEHQADMKSKLGALVKDGKLTQEQADKLLTKLEEQHSKREANRDSMDNKTEEERKAAMDTERESFKKWLGENGISEDILSSVMDGHRGMGERGGPGGPSMHR